MCPVRLLVIRCWRGRAPHARSGKLSAWAVYGRPLLDIRGAARFAILGTILGPHVIRDRERPALL
jgi:hypothetical protein